MKNKVDFVWVLTREHNEYDQHGEYFETVFKEKPDTQALSEYFSKTNEYVSLSARNIFEALNFISHVEKGGGRQGVEDVWYNLKKIELP